MKQLVLAGVMALVPAGCGGGSGLDAMTALADFQLEMDDAQKSGKITLDQLTSARDKLFNETQAAQEKEDWTAYCKRSTTPASSWGSATTAAARA